MTHNNAFCFTPEKTNDTLSLIQSSHQYTPLDKDLGQTLLRILTAANIRPDESQLRALLIWGTAQNDDKVHQQIRKIWAPIRSTSSTDFY